MFDETIYQDILSRYPEYISKEQLRLICHISKRVAKTYLDNDMIPCQNNGKATHKYMIRTSDVIAFLKDREAHPDRYRVSLLQHPIAREQMEIDYDAEVLVCWHDLLVSLLSDYPDLMTFENISRLTGYNVKTVRKWQSSGIIRVFRSGPHAFIPKEMILQYLMDESFRNISVKSRKHWHMIAMLNDMMNREVKKHV